MSDAPPPSRRRGRPRAGDTPALVEADTLATALRVFAQQGYDAASVREIARRLGVSHALLRHRYGSKRELWEACVDWSFGSMNSELLARLHLVAEAPDVASALRSVVTEYVTLSARFSDNMLVITREGGEGGERMEYILSRYVRPFITAGRAIIAKRQDAGELRRVPWQAIFFLVFSGGPAAFALRPMLESLDADSVMDAGDVGRVAEYADGVATIVLSGLMSEPGDE